SRKRKRKGDEDDDLMPKKRKNLIDPKLKRCMKKIMNCIISYNDTPDGRAVSEIFMDLPPRRDFPDYYEIIKKPLCINKILQKIDDGKYPDLDELEKDFTQLCKNAQIYNEEKSMVYENSLVLEKIFENARTKLEAKFLADKAERETRDASHIAAVEATGSNDDTTDPSVKMRIKLKNRKSEAMPSTSAPSTSRGGRRKKAAKKLVTQGFMNLGHPQRTSYGDDLDANLFDNDGNNSGEKSDQATNQQHQQQQASTSHQKTPNVAKRRAWLWKNPLHNSFDEADIASADRHQGPSSSEASRRGSVCSSQSSPNRASPRRGGAGPGGAKSKKDGQRSRRESLKDASANAAQKLYRVLEEQALGEAVGKLGLKSKNPNNDIPIQDQQGQTSSQPSAQHPSSAEKAKVEKTASITSSKVEKLTSSIKNLDIKGSKSESGSKSEKSAKTDGSKVDKGAKIEGDSKKEKNVKAEGSKSDKNTKTDGSKSEKNSKSEQIGAAHAIPFNRVPRVCMCAVVRWHRESRHPRGALAPAVTMRFAYYYSYTFYSPAAANIYRRELD
ncbi:unnamed protein product, partial [Trichogramma brassicae]